MSCCSLCPSDLLLLQGRTRPSSLLLGRVLASGYSTRIMPGLPVGCFHRNARIRSTSDRTPIRSVMPDIAKDYQTFPTPLFPKPEADPKTVVSIILGGGSGSQLFPLTKASAKPAVPIGGCYRLIDFPVSNCIYSGINKIYILTQYNSQSLNRHKMDYVDFLQKHIDSGADISVSCVPIDERSSGYELVKMDELGRIMQILRKPPGEDLRLIVVF
ncbi:hypothetical protein MLD38_025752 [Melastoma candidum]|uniref:Uncharacterized protein n=1 Tax=Melastoma candidum TaxID=119954 RepID=A0ACB9NZ84_9MYRT|nr:hypothetical protein MLD38_025752 [Melastoma candidum]